MNWAEPKSHHKANKLIVHFS